MTARTEVRQQVGRLVLNRPDTGNALDDAMIDAMIDGLARLVAEPAVRVVVLLAEGKAFSVGCDPGWIQGLAEAGPENGMAGVERLAALLAALDACPKPTIVRVQGAATAEAVGLIACCDVAVASDEAEFALVETRMGLVPAVTAPHLVRALGTRQARRWMLTGDRFKAAEAKAAGLVHEVVTWNALDVAVDRAVVSLLRGAPQALADTKAMVSALDGAAAGTGAERFAAVIRGAEAREGVAAHLEKRRPVWSR